MSAPKKNISVRFDEATRREIARVSKLSNLADADIIRICVANGLPIIEETFTSMAARFKDLANQPEAKDGREVTPVTSPYVLNDAKRRKAG